MDEEGAGDEDEIQVVGPIISQEVAMEEEEPPVVNMEQDQAEGDDTVTYDPPDQASPPPPQVPSILVPDELELSFGSDVSLTSDISFGSIADLIGSTTEDEQGEAPASLVQDELDVSLTSISELLGSTTEEEADSASDLDTSVELLASVEVIIEEPEP